MPEQSELVEGHQIEQSFFDDPTEGATLRTKNDPSDPYQRTVIASRGRKSDFKVLVTLSSCVHGYLDSTVPNPIPATLIVMRYEFRTTNKKNSYESIYTELEFSNETTTSLMDEPYVIAYAPFQQPGKARITMNDVTQNHAAHVDSIGVNAAIGGANVSGQWGTTTQENFKKEYFQLLQASRELSKDIGPGPNTVWWDMAASQNPGKGAGEGVPPSLQVAVLVQRKDLVKFKVNFKLSLKAGIWHDAISALKTFWGIERDDPILFDPNLPPVGDMTGIDKNHLGILNDKGSLQNLGFFRNLSKLDE